MKKLLFILFMIFTCLIVNAQLKMNCSGNIGINKDPGSYKLEIYGWSNAMKIYNGAVSDIVFHSYGGDYGGEIRPTGNYTCDLGDPSYYWKNLYCQKINGSIYTGSDRRYKENIQDISSALDVIIKLNGIKYDLKKEFAYNLEFVKDAKEIEKEEKRRKDKYGLIAQDVEKVLPSLVYQDDSTGYYSINYVEIIPILIEALKEQNNSIKSLESEILALKSTEKSTSTEMSAPIEFESNSDAFLGKNAPNPFSENTKIEFYLPATIAKASLHIYDLQGKQIKGINVVEREFGEITIYSNELMPGMYYYTLIADGQEIGSYKMILTD